MGRAPNAPATARRPYTRPIERSHWEHVYRSVSSELSWFQAEAAVSLELIDALHVARGAAVLDVGGGASPLAGQLLERGFGDVTVLDIAGSGLAEARRRLGPAANEVAWLAEDVRSWSPSRLYDLWHDRAVLHFFVDAADRRRYLAVLDRALAPGGGLVVATFAPDGPDRCSGLPVVRYGVADLAALFGAEYELVAETREVHRTPRDVRQPFTWAAFRRVLPRS